MPNPDPVDIKGPPGEDGSPGQNGAPGADGSDGESAYQIAVDNGFTGTETEWLASLKGADGAAGPAGTNGTNGEDGKSAYQYAVDGGYTGAEAEFQALMGSGPWLPLAGGAMTGPLTVQAPTAGMNPATKAYVDSKAGGVPSGVIVMWSGAANAIPTGWALCNGSNGTPDLRNRFIVGAGSSYSVGATGGSESVTLTVEQMPSHNHALQSVRESGNISYMPIPQWAGDIWVGSTDNTGGSQAHENRPPYYALCFIMKQ